MDEALIIIGVDGSPTAARAVQWAADNAPLLNARVIVAYAFEPPVPLLPTTVSALPAPFDGTWQHEVRTALETEWCAPLRDADVKYDARIVAGDPATALIDCAREEGATLIVVGRRGRNPLTELALGSVSHRLCRHAPCPVLVVSAPAQ